MKRFWGSIVVLAASGSAVQAQDWTAVEDGDVRSAFVEAGDASLRVDCTATDALAPNAVQVAIGGAVINGPIAFTFDNGTTVAGIFTDNRLVADTPENAAVFTLLRDLLRLQNGVIVDPRDTEERSFALRGSGRAIGDCPVTLQTVADEPTEPEDVVEDEVEAEPEVSAPVARPAVIPNVVGDLQSPIPNDPFVDYRIADCDGTRGLMLMNYDTLNGVTELSDFCLDEETGTLNAAEPRGGLVPTESSEAGRAFEVPDSGTDRFSRVRIELGQGLGCGDVVAESSVNYAIPNGTLTRNPETLFLYARGFTVSDAALEPRDLFDTETTLLSIRDFSVRRIDPATTETGLLPQGADMRGILSANGRDGSFDVTSGNGFWVGDAAGKIDISVTDAGDVIGTGQFRAQNQRLVGQEPYDWVTMTADIPYLRGYVLGTDGSAVIAYGVVRGSYVDVSDRTHEFEASATFTACADG